MAALGVEVQEDVAHPPGSLLRLCLLLLAGLNAASVLLLRYSCTVSLPK